METHLGNGLEQDLEWNQEKISIKTLNQNKISEKIAVNITLLVIIKYNRYLPLEHVECFFQ